MHNANNYGVEPDHSVKHKVFAHDNCPSIQRYLGAGGPKLWIIG